MTNTHNSSAAVPPHRWGLWPRRGTPKRVGVVSPHYGLERVSYMLPVSGYTFHTVRRVPFQRLEKSGTFWANTPLLLDRSASLVHTFNMLPLNGPRFVTSFEVELPRYLGHPRPWQMKLGRRLMASDRCAALLALTDTAARLASAQIRDAGLPDVAAKVGVFRGAVRPSESDAPRDAGANTSGPIRVIFVGADGLRKGLEPLVNALEKLRAGGVEVELTVVSSINVARSYVFGQHSPSADALRARLATLPWVRHHAALSNAEVRKLMRSHDVFALPSFDESLGWSVIEAGMEGLPSLVTNIFAFPELVEDDVTGRLIPLELNAQSRWTGIFVSGDAKRDAIERANRAIEDGIIAAIHRLAPRRELLAEWGAAARAKMHAMYHPDRAAAQLKTIYDGAISATA